MKSKFQIEQRTRIVSQKQKKKNNNNNNKFSGKLISLPIENSSKVWSKFKSGMRILRGR